MRISTSSVRIADGTHQEIVGGQLKQMLLEWHEIASMNEKALLSRHGKDAGRQLADIVSTLVYAQIAKAAFSLCSVATSWS